MARKTYCDRCKAEIPQYDAKNVFTRILTRKKYDVDIRKFRYELCQKCFDELGKFLKGNGKEVDGYDDDMDEEDE